jgi:DNA-directed RNA polymerase subunit alpha
MGLSLKDSTPGFDPLKAIGRFDETEDADFAETDQL